VVDLVIFMYNIEKGAKNNSKKVFEKFGSMEEK
jgi:hypothetical protein